MTAMNYQNYPMNQTMNANKTVNMMNNNLAIPTINIYDPNNNKVYNNHNNPNYHHRRANNNPFNGFKMNSTANNLTINTNNTLIPNIIPSNPTTPLYDHMGEFINNEIFKKKHHKLVHHH